jgi:hypothetical protein
VGSRIGVEILGLLSMDEPREDRDEEPLPLIDSVSLDQEKEREPLVAWLFLSGELGGVVSPIGTRLSTSLHERLSLRIVSFSSMVALWGGGQRKVVLAHGDNKERNKERKRIYTHEFILHLLCVLRQVKEAHGSRSRAVCNGG